MMEALDKKLNDVFTGKVVRKDLVHQIKKAANVPSFVLEFLLSKYCAWFGGNLRDKTQREKRKEGS